VLFQYIFTREEFEKYTDDWFGMLTGPDKLDIKIHKIYPMAEAAQAQMVKAH
jgi:NADPH:quinone reductase